VFITNITWSGSSDDEQPTEEVTFIFGAMIIAYQATNPDGSLAPAVRGGWSEITNSASVQDTISLKS
jgi:type VI protein secretion system component Hcp